MNDIVSVLAWPGVALILGIFAVVLYAPQFRNLLTRAKRIGTLGIEVHDQPQIPALPAAEAPSHEFFRAFENPLALANAGVAGSSPPLLCSR